jgi:hypothetical protein
VAHGGAFVAVGALRCLHWRALSNAARNLARKYFEFELFVQRELDNKTDNNQ